MIRALLVDDEEPARDRLRRLLEAHTEVQVVAEAADGLDAVDKIERLKPDLVFLDVQMPGRTGLEVAALIPPPRPDIVFCTAFDQYAINAFELNAVDYLLKPVNRNRLARSVERARTNLETRLGALEDLKTAGAVQRRLYPSQNQLLSHFEYSGVCKPARSVGGDYFDFILLHQERLAVALGDVSGKGVQAALLMASLQGRVQSLAAGAGEDLGGLVASLNRRVWESTSQEKYATFFYSVFDDQARTVTYVNAGHQPPMLFRGARPPLRLSEGGTALGFFEESRFDQRTVQLQPGDSILMFTDGVLEAVGENGEEFGEERLVRLARECRSDTAARFQERVLAAVEEFADDGLPQQDDITVVVVQCRGPN